MLNAADLRQKDKAYLFSSVATFDEEINAAHTGSLPDRRAAATEICDDGFYANPATFNAKA